jgi:hypothetical protein
MHLLICLCWHAQFVQRCACARAQMLYKSTSAAQWAVAVGLPQLGYTKPREHQITPSAKVW